MQMEKACSAEDLLQMCLAALESEGKEAGVRERLGLPKQDGGPNGKKKDVSTVQKALLQVNYQMVDPSRHYRNSTALPTARGMPALRRRPCSRCIVMVERFRHHCNSTAVPMARKGMPALRTRPCSRCGLSLESVATSLHLR